MPIFVWVGAGLVMGAWMLALLKLMDSMDGQGEPRGYDDDRWY